MVEIFANNGDHDHMRVQLPFLFWRTELNLGLMSCLLKKLQMSSQQWFIHHSFLLGLRDSHDWNSMSPRIKSWVLTTYFWAVFYCTLWVQGLAYMYKICESQRKIYMKWDLQIKIKITATIYIFVEKSERNINTCIFGLKTGFSRVMAKWTFYTGVLLRWAKKSYYMYWRLILKVSTQMIIIKAQLQIRGDIRKIFFLFPHKNICCGYSQKHLANLLLWTHFDGEVRNISLISWLN